MTDIRAGDFKASRRKRKHEISQAQQQKKTSLIKFTCLNGFQILGTVSLGIKIAQKALYSMVFGPKSLKT